MSWPTTIFGHHSTTTKGRRHVRPQLAECIGPITIQLPHPASFKRNPLSRDQVYPHHESTMPCPSTAHPPAHPTARLTLAALPLRNKHMQPISIGELTGSISAATARCLRACLTNNALLSKSCPHIVAWTRRLGSARILKLIQLR